VFWVISAYFNIRNNLPKYGTFLPGHLYTKLNNEHIFNFTTPTNWPLRNTFHRSLDTLLVHGKAQDETNDHYIEPFPVPCPGDLD
jgi:hypothetical protein